MNDASVEDGNQRNSHQPSLVPVPLKRITHPELFFGIVAPIGVDTKFIVEAISKSLSAVGYSATHVKLTELMKSVPTSVEIKQSPPEDRYRSHIEYANEVRDLFSNSGDNKDDGDAALAQLAIAGIRQARKQNSTNEETPKEKHAYILDQFKRPEEVRIIRKVYGRLFVLFSIHASVSNRKKVLKRKIRAAHGDRSKLKLKP
jgi:hypothetical protein